MPPSMARCSVSLHMQMRPGADIDAMLTRAIMCVILFLLTSVRGPCP
jgi:hypothetical protein